MTMKTSTKMYLSIMLSTACIMFYQYQLSKANLMSVDHIENEVATSRIIRSNSNNNNNNNNNNNIYNHNNNNDKNSKTNNGIITSSSTATTTTTTTTTITTTANIITSSTTDKTLPPPQPPPTQPPPPPPPPLYIITPTYRRPEQLAEITRLGYTLKHITNLIWLVIEDATAATPLVTKQLKKIGIPFEHLTAPMPDKYKKNKVKPRGVSNRNRALKWIRANATNGVFYFADDDNTYDLEIFEQMRHTKKVSMWPVGLVTKFGVSSPIVRKGKLDGFYDGWIGGRKYPIDMAGFAVNVKFFLSRPKAEMPYKPGYEEDGFLKSLAPLNYTEIELLASDCTEILTWHTQTKKNQPATPLDTKYDGTNLVYLRRIIV